MHIYKRIYIGIDAQPSKMTENRYVYITQKRISEEDKQRLDKIIYEEEKKLRRIKNNDKR